MLTELRWNVPKVDTCDKKAFFYPRIMQDGKYINVRIAELIFIGKDKREFLDV